MQRQCRYGNKCWNLQACKYHHSNFDNTFTNSKFCRYGKNCRNQPYCKFTHIQTNIPETDFYFQPQQQKKFSSNTATKSEPDIHTLHHNNVQIKQINTYSIKTFHKDVEHNSQQLFSQRQGITLKSRQDTILSSNVQKKEQKQVKQLKQLNCLNLIHQGQQQYLQHILQQFFNVRLVKSKKFDAIYQLVQDNVSLENVQVLIQQIVKIQESEFGPHFTYLKIVKTIIQKGMDFAAVCDKLQKQMKIKLLKQQKNADFLLKIPNPIDYKVLTDIQLLNISQQQQQQTTRYIIIDGDNVLNSHKTLRKYYKSKNNKKIAQGQIRLRWLLSQIQNCLLFFDHQQVTKQIYDDIANRIMYQEEVSNYVKQVWKFANLYVEGLGEIGEDGEDGEELEDVDEEQEQDNECIDEEQNNTQNKKTADQQILAWFNNNETSNNQPPCQILLVTGDRLLIQHCLQKKPMTQISSGKHFIKYCKQLIRRKYYGNKIKKGVLKRIFTSPHL